MGRVRVPLAGREGHPRPPPYVLQSLLPIVTLPSWFMPPPLFASLGMDEVRAKN